MLCPRFRSCSLVALLALMPGCDREAKPATAAEVASAPADAKAGPGCDAAHGKVLEDELLAQCALTGQVLTVDVPNAPWKASPSSGPEAALRLEVGPEGVKVGWGQPLALEQVPEELARARRDAAQAGTGGVGWRLAIDRATPRANVAALLQALVAAELHGGHLILATEDTGSLPQPRDPKRLAELQARLGASDPSQKAMLLAKEIEEVVRPCPAAKEAFSVIATVAPDDRCSILARSLSKGLVSCGCQAEDALMTLLYSVSVDAEVPTRLGVAVPVTLDPTASSPAGTTWAELVAGLDQAALPAFWVAAN